MENFYYVVSELYPNGKRYAFTITVDGGENLIREFKRYSYAENITAFKTKKKAEEVAKYWNDGYKANGNFCIYFKED